jgi:hypothetical protein
MQIRAKGFADHERRLLTHQSCFKFKGETFCTEPPVLTHLPTAA